MLTRFTHHPPSVQVSSKTATHLVYINPPGLRVFKLIAIEEGGTGTRRINDNIDLMIFSIVW